jgi:NAD(P) transhydrogenase subunit alpha
MKLGILKEDPGENRVALLPEAVTTLKELKVDVFVEPGAGDNAYASDKDYEEAGAKVTGRKDIIASCDMIVKIHPPGKDELKNIPGGKVFLGAINPFFNKDLVEVLEKNGVTSFSMDSIPRITRAQSMDILSSQATVAGYKAVLAAATELPHFFPFFMTAAGTIRPAKVLILGAGVAGLQAIATTRKLGGVVEVFDVRSAVKEEVKSLGGKFIEVEGAKEDLDAGGYAVEQTEEFKEKQRQLIHDHSVKSNVIICTAQIPGKKAPVLLTRKTVEGMKKGSVIIDLAASTGGNCELTKNNETIVHNGVKIVGNSNFPSEIPYDSSKMFGQNILNFLKLIINEEGGINLNFEDEIVKGTCITHDKEIVNERVKESIKS